MDVQLPAWNGSMTIFAYTVRGVMLTSIIKIRSSERGTCPPDPPYVLSIGSEELVRQSAAVQFGACWWYLLWVISNYLGLSPSHNPE